MLFVRRSSRLVFLINQLEYITLALQPYPGSDEFAAFDQLSVQHVAAYADTALSLVDDFRKMMTYVSGTSLSRRMNLTLAFRLRVRPLTRPLRVLLSEGLPRAGDKVPLIAMGFRTH